ncbi:lipopolysaccharide biosynthesis protein [Flavobacterium hydrophilum]|uniref:Polysaccharide biosynthesis protein C-terminal domain-containing protein n=1 Tax=Flavobacterium hydrophilum TaxID=2211445 RepID=A0A2V4BYF8_9FLAO|nr:oligosaccharide flippase family protein [Flavobacterium hydrophilum]PXY44056.1 hypothetical protein DMB68_16580 [Flavobacterium hydrophilum]
MREFIRSFFLLGIATTIEKIIAFVLLPIYTSYFDVVEYAVIDLIFVFISTTSIFAELQLETALQRYYYDFTGKDKRMLISTNFMVIILLSILLTAIIIVFSETISITLFDKPNYNNIIKIASLQLPFINFSMLSFIVLRYEKKNKLFLILMLIKVIITLIFTLLFVVVFKLGVIGVFYSQVIGLLISSLFLFFAVKEHLSLKSSSFFLNKSFSYALPQFPARIGSTLLSFANRFFMVNYLTLTSIGLFSLSLKLASVIQLLNTAFVMAWAPFMFEQFKIITHRQNFAKVLILATCPIYCIVCGITLFSKEIIELVSTKEFYESYKYIGGLALYFSLYIFKEIVDIGPKYKEQTKYLSYTFFASVVFNLIFLFLLIKNFELPGVVLAMILTNVFLLVVSWIVSNHLYFIPHRHIQFMVLSIPTFIIAIGSMYVYPSVVYRISLFFVMFFLYSISFYKHLKTSSLNIEQYNTGLN